ncbi:MAG TPA: NADH-quinone oxidoreductase subunit NuoG [Bryobacteraceae bacterium]|nr:NADH-quinone oxidoreductase subunit NuoG [Bryobacteraceae bacterium]
MSDLVRLQIDGKDAQVPAGTLVINAAKTVGIEIPAFCYYDGLTLQAACRMCLVEVEKAPKLQTACTLVVAEGMVVRTDTPQVVQARKSMLEFLLTNHPLDCPVCDKGGECELQDLTFRYGLGESRFAEIKLHVPEKQFSPIVYFDAPRCILCYRCVRICKEGMGVGALGVVSRGAVSEITPNKGDHLECDECGMCIDICPVGALTSGVYRYKTRPWEMKHVGTVCAHCSNGCTTTLGVCDNRIMRGNNRDSSGINGEFLCVKGRYAFDFVDHPERLHGPLMRIGSRLEEVTWKKALSAVASKFAEVAGRRGKFGVIGSTRTTNEENYFLQRFARSGLGTHNIDHHRTGDVVSFLGALKGRTGAQAATADLCRGKAILVLGSDLAQQHPLLAFQIRTNWRHHQCHVYAVTRGPVREDSISTLSVRVEPGRELSALTSLRETLKAEPELVILFGDAIKGADVRRLVDFGDSLGIPVKYVCLVDYANSRGAVEMELLAGAGDARGLSLPEMLSAPDLDALWVVGANPLKDTELSSTGAFVVVQDLFLTETARRADVVLPAASAYEKTGSITNVCGEVQQLKRAIRAMGVKTDLEILRLLAAEMKLDPADWELEAVPVSGALLIPESRPELVRSACDTLFTSGTLGRYSKVLNMATEAPGGLYR